MLWNASGFFFFFLLLSLLSTIIAATSSYTDSKLKKSAGDQIQADYGQKIQIPVCCMLDSMALHCDWGPLNLQPTA